MLIKFFRIPESPALYPLHLGRLENGIAAILLLVSGLSAAQTTAVVVDLAVLILEVVMIASLLKALRAEVEPVSVSAPESPVKQTGPF